MKKIGDQIVDKSNVKWTCIDISMPWEKGVGIVTVETWKSEGGKIRKVKK